MYNHILVPIVFEHGKHGEDAIDVADHLLEEGGKITLLHVMEEIPAYAASHIPDGVREQHLEDAKKSLDALGSAAKAPYESAVVLGHASQTIMDYGSQKGADCIVIASHKPGFEDYFIGSTAARVVRHAKCAVHIMR